ncbi:MAG: hypothetical protein AAF616_04760 [Bacteroidota bacterium]
MKKHVLALAAVIVAVASFAQDKKVAVVTFYVNKSISMADLDGAAGAAASIASVAGNPNFDLESILIKFHKKFFTEYAEVLPFEFVPEEKVITSESYQNLKYAWDKQGDRKKTSIRRVLTSIDGYKILLTDSFDKKGQLDVIDAIEGEVDGILYVNLGYAFVKKLAVGGMGTAGVEARIEMLLYNSEGKNVFRIYENAKSKNSVALVKGIPVMEVEKILPLCQDASDQLLEDMSGHLKKINKKVDKKL